MAERRGTRRVASSPGRVRPLDAPEGPPPAPAVAEAPAPEPPPRPRPIDLEASRRALEDRQLAWARFREAWQERRDAAKRRTAPPAPGAPDETSTKP